MRHALLLSFAFAFAGLAHSSDAGAYQIQDINGQCPQGLRWASMPVDWYLNQDGSDDFSFSTVEQIMTDSFDAWEAPCCSAFRANYRGTTSLTAYQNNGNIVLSFVENQWDNSWGPIDSVIGVTLTQYSPTSCRLSNAPIVFNGVRFTFTNNGTGTDLQSIATHEIGHLLGLDHSNVSSATMYYAYQGGTGSRTLHNDDINGVCFLYNRPCTCTTSNDCLAGDVCVGGTCENVPCTSNADCQTGLECELSTGECRVPPCTGDQDCPGGFYCKADGTCASYCPVCRDCQTNADCGSGGVCTSLNKCVTYCQDGTCPGDSVCFDYQGTPVCFNADVNEAGLCPEGYVCQADVPQGECQTDIQCAAGETCSANNECIPRPDPCDNVQCAAGQVCQNGTCVLDSSNNTANNSSNNTSAPTNNTSAPTNNTSATTNNTSSPANNNNGGDAPSVVIVLDEENSGTSSSCAVGGGDASWLGLAGAALIGLVRRR